MKLQQLRYVHEVAQQGLSISEAADKLHTSQPGISKQIRLLEEELGVDIFVRSRNRMIEVTPAGKAILTVAARMLRDAENLKRLGEDFSNDSSGSLTVVTTHTQARYALPKVVKRFMSRYPKVRLNLRQGAPDQIWRLVDGGFADIAIASEPKERHPSIAMLSCYDLPRIVVTPRRHPLLRRKPLTLKALAEYPIITYDDEFIGNSKLLRAFSSHGLTPNLVLNAIDPEVMKAYVELGLGVAIIAKMAFDPRRDRGLSMIDASHLLDSNTIYIGFHRNNYLRRFALDFIEMLVPRLTADVVRAAIDGETKLAV